MNNLSYQQLVQKIVNLENKMPSVEEMSKKIEELKSIIKKQFGYSNLTVQTLQEVVIKLRDTYFHSLNDIMSRFNQINDRVDKQINLADIVKLSQIGIDKKQMKYYFQQLPKLVNQKIVHYQQKNNQLKNVFSYLKKSFNSAQSRGIEQHLNRFRGNIKRQVSISPKKYKKQQVKRPMISVSKKRNIKKSKKERSSEIYFLPKSLLSKDKFLKQQKQIKSPYMINVQNNQMTSSQQSEFNIYSITNVDQQNNSFLKLIDSLQIIKNQYKQDKKSQISRININHYDSQRIQDQKSLLQQLNLIDLNFRSNYIVSQNDGQKDKALQQLAKIIENKTTQDIQSNLNQVYFKFDHPNHYHGSFIGSSKNTYQLRNYNTNTSLNVVKSQLQGISQFIFS